MVDTKVWKCTIEPSQLNESTATHRQTTGWHDNSPTKQNNSEEKKMLYMRLSYVITILLLSRELWKIYEHIGLFVCELSYRWLVTVGQLVCQWICFLSVNFCLWVVCRSVVCRWVVVLPIYQLNPLKILNQHIYIFFFFSFLTKGIFLYASTIKKLAPGRLWSVVYCHIICWLLMS